MPDCRCCPLLFQLTQQTIYEERFPPPILLGSLSLAALSLVFSSPAEAIILNVNGLDYDVTTFYGSYNDNSSRFSPTEMPWWGNESLAIDFATALGGPPFQGLPTNFFNFGPFFAHGTIAFFEEVSVLSKAFNIEDSVLSYVSNNSNFPFNYAVATPATPVPFESDALPVVSATLFLAGGLWWKRRRDQAKVADFVAQK